MKSRFNNISIEFGKPTKEEKDLTRYIGNCLADYFEKKPTDRGDLICALTFILVIIFTKDTPLEDVNEQCNEIDALCDFLKFKARRKEK